MSLLLEFRTPQNREASAAGIGTNLCFPTVTPPTDAIDCKGGALPWPNGKAARDAGPTSHPRQSPPTRFRDLPIASLTLRNYQ
jgi:hypothetical protein